MVKNLPASAGDAGSIPGPERSPGGGNGNPLQYSCLEIPMDRGAWRATVRGVSESRTRLGNSTRWGKRDLVQIRKGQTWLECLGQGDLMTPSEAGLSPVS